MDQPHFRGPPLRDWLLPLTSEGVTCVRQKPLSRALRSLTEPWPELSVEGPPAGLVVVVDEVDHEWFELAVRHVRPGGWLVELRPLAAGVLQALLGWRETSDEAAQLGYASALRFAGRGLFDVQQWACSDPAELLVTCGRVR